jgi:hypothetical protein
MATEQILKVTASAFNVWGSSGLVGLGKSKMHGEEACAERYD